MMMLCACDRGWLFIEGFGSSPWNVEELSLQIVSLLETVCSWFCFVGQKHMHLQEEVQFVIAMASGVEDPVFPWPH